MPPDPPPLACKNGHSPARWQLRKQGRRCLDCEKERNARAVEKHRKQRVEERKEKGAVLKGWIARNWDSHQ